MEWTTEPPTQRGWYWAKWGESSWAMAIQVIEDFNEVTKTIDIYIDCVGFDSVKKWHEFDFIVRSKNPFPEPEHILNARGCAYCQHKKDEVK